MCIILYVRSDVCVHTVHRVLVWLASPSHLLEPIHGMVQQAILQHTSVVNCVHNMSWRIYAIYNGFTISCPDCTMLVTRCTITHAHVPRDHFTHILPKLRIEAPASSLPAISCKNNARAGKVIYRYRMERASHCSSCISHDMNCALGGLQIVNYCTCKCSCYSGIADCSIIANS